MSQTMKPAIAPVRDAGYGLPLSARKGLTRADRQIVADILTWDTQR